PHVRGKALSVIGQLQPLTVGNVLTDLPRAVVGYPYARLTQIPSTAGLVLVGLCLLGCFAWWARDLAHARTAGMLSLEARPLLIGALSLATPVGLLLYSLLDTDLWLARGLTASLPAAAL